MARIWFGLVRQKLFLLGGAFPFPEVALLLVASTTPYGVALLLQPYATLDGDRRLSEPTTINHKIRPGAIR